MPPHQTFTLKAEKQNPPADGARDPPLLYGLKATYFEQIGGTVGRRLGI
jgi:hypothetical protein